MAGYSLSNHTDREYLQWNSLCGHPRRTELVGVAAGQDEAAGEEPLAQGSSAGVRSVLRGFPRLEVSLSADLRQRNGARAGALVPSAFSNEDGIHRRMGGVETQGVALVAARKCFDSGRLSAPHCVLPLGNSMAFSAFGTGPP